MISPLNRMAAIAGSVVLLSFSLISCSAATESSVADATSGIGEGAEEGTDNDRVFDSTDDAVVTAMEAALKGDNAAAEWDGSMLVVTMDGSIDEPTAWLPCGAANALIAETEAAKLIYDDGELLCSERPGYADED